jgi:hypothetical protein
MPATTKIIRVVIARANLPLLFTQESIDRPNQNKTVF